MHGLILVASLALLSGCVSAPVPELQAYASAYEQVRSGGNLLLDEDHRSWRRISVAAAAGEESNPTPEACNPAAEEIPPCFDPNQALREAGIQANEDPSIMARRAALDVVTEYNSLLLALAEGRSGEALTARFSQLQGLVTTAATLSGAATAGLSTLLPGAVDLLKTLATQFENTRANGTIRESIIASKDDISALFRLLIEDTTDIYAIYYSAQSIELTRLNKEKNTARLAGQAQMQADFQRQVDAQKQRMHDFYASVGAYTRVLAAAQQALDNLVIAAADRDSVSSENVAAVITDAGAVKAKAESFFNLIRAVRAAAPAAAPASTPS